MSEPHGTRQSWILKEHGTNRPAISSDGIFAIGRMPEAAVKAAVMVEDVARTVFYALQIGTPDVIPPEEVERGHRRYLKDYGQS